MKAKTASKTNTRSRIIFFAIALEEYSHSITFTIIYYQKCVVFAKFSMVQFIITA